MQNMIKNAYTAYRIDNSTDYGNYISVSGAKFNGNILSFDMWLYIEDNGSEIVSQKDGFSIGISQDKVILRLPGKNTISLRSSAVGIPEKQWVNLYFGYDGKTVSIFINGNMIGEADMSGKITNANDILIGAEFTGYIRSLRIYSSVLDETVFRKYFMASEYRSADMKELSAFLDLTQESITDLCKTDIKAKINGGCACMDLVDVYCPAEGSYLYIQNSEDVAPGGFDSGQFSVYTKVYIRPSANGRQLLWINGEWNDQDKIALAADKQNGKTKFTAIFGSDEYTFSCEIQDYVWTDILLSSTGSKVIAYINGEKQEITAAFKRNKEGDLKIGGSQKAADMISSHYFHTVVVFDRALTADDAQAFMTDHPYIFEDGLIALISFEGGSAYEIAKGLTVTANKNGLLAAQRTVDVPPTDKYQFRLNYTKDAPSEMKKWEAEQVVAACRDFVEKMVGCSVTVQPAVHDMLIKYISNNSELLQESSKLYTKPTIQSDDVVSAIGNTDSGLIKAIFTVLMLSSAATAAYETAAMIGSSAATMSANKYAAIIAIGCVAAVSAAAVIVAEVNEKHKDKPDDDDDDDSKDDVTVKLLSISFQHSPDDYEHSAVRCRNFQGTVNAPEWTYEKKTVAPALYIASKVKNVKVKIKFKIIDNSKKKASSYSVAINANVESGEKNLLDNLCYSGKGLKADTEYEVTAESGITATVKQAISYSQLKLWWSCTVNEKEKALPNTTSDIYIIPQIPDSPIFLQKGYDKYFPAIEFLDIYTRMLSDGNLIEDEVPAEIDENSIRNIANVIFNSACFQYNGGATPRYVAEDYNSTTRVSTFIFKERNFFYDIDHYIAGTRNKLLIECEVYASILGYFLRLLHVGFNIVMIKNPIVVGQPIEQLVTNPVYAAGRVSEGPGVRRFNYHVVIEVNNINNTPVTPAIYDCSLGVMNGTTVKPVVGLAYEGPYKNTVFQAGSTVTRFNDIGFAFAVNDTTFDPE